MRGTLEGHGTYGGRGEGEGPGTTPVCPQCDKKSKPNPVPVPVPVPNPNPNPPGSAGAWAGRHRGPGTGPLHPCTANGGDRDPPPYRAAEPQHLVGIYTSAQDMGPLGRFWVRKSGPGSTAPVVVVVVYGTYTPIPNPHLLAIAPRQPCDVWVIKILLWMK